MLAVLDAIVLLLLLAGVAIVDSGGGGVHVGGMRVSAQHPDRPR
jgi:hypothetical protein